MEYRIKENIGQFTIQVKKVTKKTTGFLWWKKTRIKEQWVVANDFGQPLWLSRGIPFIPPCIAFKTLEEAEKRVDEFQRKPVYHYIQ